MEASNDDVDMMAKAREIIELRFRDASSLDEYTRQLSLTEAQLASTIQTNIDHVKKAMDTIKQSEDTMAKLTGEFGGMQEQLGKSRSQLGKYEHIRSINIANRNIQTTLSRIENFNSIPAMVKRLQEALTSNPESLMVVYLSTQSLETWRDELIAEVKGSSRRSSISSPGSTGYTRSPEVYNKIIDVLGDHFDIVLQLSQQVRQSVTKHVCECFYLSVDEPALLVRAVEVMMLIEDHEVKKYNLLSDIMKENLPNLSHAFEEEVVVSLRQAFDARIQERYVQCMLQSADEGKTGIEATINAATKGMLDLAFLKSEVTKCFPPTFKALKIYREQFEEYMLPQVAALYSQNIQNLELGDLLRMVSWLHNYNLQIASLDVGDPPDDFEEAIENLMEEYLERAGKQTRDWFANIEKRDSEVLPESDGCLVTRDPEDMLNIVNMQVSVAKEQLPSKLRYKAIKSCVDELSAAQARLREDVEILWKSTQVENICAVVNDSYRMQDKVEHLLDDFDRDEGREEIQELQEAMDELCRSYVVMAVDATKFAAMSVMEDLKEPILHQVFTPPWEDGSEQFSQITTRTLRDWFSDLSMWLPEYFFAKLVRECYDQTVSAYIETCMGKKVKPFQNSARASQQVINDRFAFSEFFLADFSAQLAASGMRKPGEVEQSLDVMTHISKLIMAPAPTDVEPDIKGMLRHFGTTGEKAILHIVGLKTLPKAQLDDWKFVVQQDISEVGKECDFEQEKYNLPWWKSNKTTASKEQETDADGEGINIGTGGFASTNPFGSMGGGGSNPFGEAAAAKMEKWKETAKGISITSKFSTPKK
ncbi:hypothetical protein TL16_g05905 [Triparma laevis f. inornata]|uniref:Exocyst complex component Sec6 n=2 Tax=Triparma laevis TaxID=1534972 RepID=A0A9W7FMC9_9STRA|nr:hypothetical protein TL16_g05905 [Triparma laevis f. inornata]GMI14606.1 hypothetical protein TrLO_g7157 [Triparma laevis f. longispina]